MSVTTYHECIGGFLQRTGATNGVARLALALESQLDPATNRVTYHPYRTDVADRARFLAYGADWRQGKLRINVYAYSYGCHTAAAFCDALESVGLRANAVVLCDPVARGRYVWTMAPRRLLPLLRVCQPAITLPHSVGRVDVFTQDTAPPWPSRVYHAGRLVEPTRLQYPHVHMDNSPEFIRHVERVAHLYDTDEWPQCHR